MGFTVAEAQAELQRKQRIKQQAATYTPEEAQAELQRRTQSESLSQILAGKQPRFRRPEEAIQAAGGMTPYLAAIRSKLQAVPLGAQQETQRMAGKIPGAAWHHYLAQSALIPQQQQIIQQYPEYARTGRLGADIATPALLAAAAPAGAATVGASILGGAAVAPSGKIPTALGALAGAAAPFAPKILELGEKGVAKGAKALWKLRGAFSPNKYASSLIKNIPGVKSAESVLSELGQGKSLEENTKNIATKIRGAKKAVSDYFTKAYGGITKRAGSEGIYSQRELPNSYKSTFAKKKTIMPSIEKFQGKVLPVFKEVTEDIPKDSPVKTYSTDIKNAHQDFVKNQNFGNAHKLQSVLGDEARRVLKNPLSNLQDRSVAQGWLKSQKKLLNDIDTHLKGVDPTGTLAQDYKDLGEEYKDEAIPYKNKYITKIATGKVTNPRSLTTVFKNPESDVSKVVRDLGANAPDQIIYNDLRASAGKNPTAKKLLTSLSGLEKKGLQSYVSPKLEQQGENLLKTHAQEEFLKHVGTKPTAKNILKAAKKMDDNNILRNLHPLTQDRIDTLEKISRRTKWLKRGAGLAGLGLLVKEFLPSHIRRELL